MNIEDQYYTATCNKCGKKLYSKYDTVYFATGPRYSYDSLCKDCYIKITGHNPKPSLWLQIKSFFKNFSDKKNHTATSYHFHTVLSIKTNQNSE